MGNKKLNKRRRNRRFEASKASILIKPDGRSREHLDEEYARLNAKIGVLEEFLTGSVIQQERLRRQRREGIIPPPDHPSYKRRKSSRRMILSQEEAYYQQRQQHGLTFLALFIAACAIAWWLLGSGGFQ